MNYQYLSKISQKFKSIFFEYQKFRILLNTFKYGLFIIIINSHCDNARLNSHHDNPKLEEEAIAYYSGYFHLLKDITPILSPFMMNNMEQNFSKEYKMKIRF